jgi:hypothetical protein
MRTAHLTAATVALATTTAALAGYVRTDRFGYDGTITRHDTLADAQNGNSIVNTISVTDRDLSLGIANNDSIVSDRNLALGSWWYTTDSQGRAGWGNTNGNTGVGYMQLFDDNGSTDTSVSMGFANFDGTNYTDYVLSIEGQNADAADFSRLSAIDNVNDGGIWHSWSINLTATGLEGKELGSSGIIESTNQPTGVTGTITGIFQITENQGSTANEGFYAVSFDLNMDNWAWDNRNDLMTQDDDGNPIPDTFAASTFRGNIIPLPHPAAMAGFGVFTVATLRRRR